MALEKDFLKKAKRDIKVPTDDLKARIMSDDADDKGEVPEELAPAPEKPAEAEPEPKVAKKPDPPEKPAESTVAPEKPAPVAAKAKPEPKEDEKVPVHLMVSERKRADAAERAREAAEQRLRDAETRLAEANKPKPEVKKEPEDPEPDRKTKPIEWSEWKTRDLDRRSAALESKMAKFDERETQRTQAQQEEYLLNENVGTFEKLIESSAGGGIEDRIPAVADIKERYAFIREKQGAMNIINGMDENTAKSKRTLDMQLMQFLGVQFQNKRNPITALSNLADHLGYKPKEAEAESGTRKPAAATKSASERIADATARESAARSSATMPGAPPKAASDAEMTADKWLKLSPKERTAFKKSNPKFSLDRLMAEAEA